MAARGTFDSKRAQAKELYDEGYSCNAIAQKLDASPSTVSRWAKTEGLSFDRSQTALAVRAHTIDLAADRLLLAQKMVQVASDVLDSLDGEYLVYSFGGQENLYSEHLLDSPPVEVVRNAVTTAGIAFDKASKVLEKSTEGLTGAHSLLDSLATGFAKAAADYEASLPDGQ